MWVSVDEQKREIVDGIWTTSSSMLGLLHFKSGIWERHFAGVPFAGENGVELQRDDVGRVWTYSFPSLICRHDEAGWDVFREGESGLPTDLGGIAALNTNPFAIDKNGDVWLAAGDGLNPKKWT